MNAGPSLSGVEGGRRAHFLLRRNDSGCANPGQSDLPIRMNAVMKTSLPRSHFMILAAVWALCTVPGALLAQFSATDQAGMNAAMMKLFGENKAFSAHAEVRLLDASKAESMGMAMEFAMNAGRMRADIDLGAMRNKQMPPAMTASLKQAGLDKVTSIVLPERKATVVIYPVLQAYAEVPMATEDLDDLEKKYTAETTQIGTEKIGELECIKNKVVLTTEKNERHEAIVWNAPTLKQFPIRIEMKRDEGLLQMTFQNVKLDPPAESQFALPEGYRKEESMERLMQGAMSRLLSNAPGKLRSSP